MLEPYGAVEACNGIALPLPTLLTLNKISDFWVINCIRLRSFNVSMDVNN
jgi:hypothetical protein